MAIVALINSSTQRKNYTGFTLNIVKEELEQNNVSVIEVNLKNFSLPFPGEEIIKDDSKEMQDLLKRADSYIIGCPEYNGSFTAKLKLMVENAGFPSVLKGKPIGLVGLASGILGATKSLEQQRTLFSHIGGFVLPRVVSLSQIEKRFDDDGNCINEKTEKDLRMAAQNMISFLELIKKH
ncbi:MAG: NAD(P)H-dependent oxidoreductase [Melioribacteraceae bacterium]|nr:NAD(P)H-dependent oxidoreductase [Melioribacteraceae bacterium]